MTRRLARETALQMLFQIDVGNNPMELAKLTLSESGLSDASYDFALKLVEGTINHQAEIDEIIKKHTAEWELDRLANVDRNAMRMALYEIKYCPDIPSSVSINESIELVKKYSTDESAKFVNGILDSIRKDLNL